MLLADITIVVPFVVVLFFWTRGVWRQSTGDLIFSAVALAAALGLYAYFYRYTVLSDVPPLVLLACAAVGLVVALLKRRRSLPAKVPAACAGIMLCLSGLSYVAEQQWNASANSLLVIAPYRRAGTWVFDEPRLGLQAEPFVAGIPELIDKLVAEAEIPNAEKGFRLTFSARPFPGHQAKVVWRRGDSGGNWYYSEKYDMEGWLCPALFKYFKRAPNEIYVKAEPKYSSSG